MLDLVQDRAAGEMEPGLFTGDLNLYCSRLQLYPLQRQFYTDGTSLVIVWCLRFCAPIAEDPGFNPWSGN